MLNRTQVVVSGIERKVVAYGGVRGMLEGLEDGTPHEVPVGTAFRLDATILTDLQASNGQQLPRNPGLILRNSRTFLRGRVVEGEEATQLLLPPMLRGLTALTGGLAQVMVLGAEDVRVVAIIQGDGTEVGIELRDDDIPPPADASPYLVGESPEEIAASVGVTGDTLLDEEQERRFCPNCLTDNHPVDPDNGLTEAEAEEERARRTADGAGMGGVGPIDDLDEEKVIYDDDLDEASASADAGISEVPETSDPYPRDVGGESQNA